MPYILQSDRDKYIPYLKKILGYSQKKTITANGMEKLGYELSSLRNLITNEGELNYNLSYLLWSYFDENPSYLRANEITDAINTVYDVLLGTGQPHEINTWVKFCIRTLCEATQVYKIRGVLRDVEAEFRRRRMDDYEDSKIANRNNGDIL